MQIEIVSIENLVAENHPYRKLKKTLNFEKIIKSAELKMAKTGAKGYSKERLLQCLILQFMEDLSDREFERFMSENVAGKWFCGFGILEKTPDFTSFCVFRNNLGNEKVKQIFDEVKEQLKSKGYCKEVYTFIDATALISKLQIWEERDEAVKAGYEKLNNANIEKFSADKDAKIGSKGENKFWYGYKKHVAVDTQSGLITNVAVTPANVTDGKGAKLILPEKGAVLGDKGYIEAISAILAKGLHPMIILRNNMKNKIKEFDKWLSKLRSPYERTFSKQNKRVRYKGTIKNQFSEFLYAIAYNFRRLLALEV